MVDRRLKSNYYYFITTAHFCVKFDALFCHLGMFCHHIVTEHAEGPLAAHFVTSLLAVL